MNKALALVLLLGVLLSVCSHAGAAEIVHPRWVIVLTVTDLTTGTKLEQRELDPRLQFDDLGHCKSVVAKAGPIPSSDHFGAVITCLKVQRKEVTL